jgi:Carbohydrate-binding module 48 (Isoamylase N-terminal domain)
LTASVRLISFRAYFRKRGEYAGPIKEVERRLNEILKQISHTEVRRRKMKNKPTEKAKSKTKKVRFNLYAPEAERVFLAGDFNGCVLVIPEVFGMRGYITLYPGELPQHHL